MAENAYLLDNKSVKNFHIFGFNHNILCRNYYL